LGVPGDSDGVTGRGASLPVAYRPLAGELFGCATGRGARGDTATGAYAFVGA
jgi:hypothetical protein